MGKKLSVEFGLVGYDKGATECLSSRWKFFHHRPLTH